MTSIGIVSPTICRRSTSSITLPVIASIWLRVICMDDMGKEAVRDGLKVIKLQNVKTKPEMSMTFDSGVLDMHCAYALLSDGIYSDNDIRALLMQKL